MILEIVKKTKVAKEIIFQCDCCHKIYNKNFKSIYLDKEYHFCSMVCANEEKKRGGLINDVTKNTCLTTYGVENPFQNAVVKEKIKSSNLEHYGVENVSQSEDIKRIKRETCLSNFGVEMPLQSQQVKDKYIKTFLEIYGVSNPSQNKEIFEKPKIICEVLVRPDMFWWESKTYFIAPHMRKFSWCRWLNL